MTRLTTVLVGNESLLVQCAGILLQRGHGIAAIASQDGGVRRWADQAGVPVVAPGPGLDARLEAVVPDGFDWLLSIANLTVLPEPVVRMARAGAINFHDGPLPRYAGLNVPVWALLAGEGAHGITWHLIEPAVDAGDIVEQRLFDIQPDDTAFSLNARCYAAAIESFPAVVAAMESGVPARRAQDLGARTLFRRDQRPAHLGHLDFSEPADTVARMVRALDHGGYWNPLCLAKITTPQGVRAVGRAEVVAGQGTPGQVLEGGTSPVIACGTGAVRLDGLTCLGGLPVQDALMQGTHLPPPDPALDAVAPRVAAGDGHWRRALDGFVPGGLGTPGHGAGLAERALPARLDPVLALAMLSFHTDAPCNAAFASADTLDLHRRAPGDVAAWVPVVITGETPADRAEHLHAAARLAARFPAMARDLIGRDPALSPVGVPALGLSLGDGPIPGCALCVTGDGRLVGDLSRITEAELDLFAARLVHMAGTDPEAAPTTLVCPADRAILDRINATDTEFDASPMHRLFESQVARSPDAVALVCEGVALSYADLNARANRVAHVLRGMGVGPDVPVALSTRRGPGLLIGALGILKAGGAYVPVDPSYPADRRAHFLSDSGAPVLVTERALLGDLPPHRADLLVLDTDTRLDAAPVTNPDGGAGPGHLAYLIYTSGSTGLPKGVMVEHGNVANFFRGMDDHIRHDPPGVWLALTSLSFDISVLELFWTLARGFKVVLTTDEDRLTLSGTGVAVSAQRMDFSLFYWGNDDGPGARKYELLLEGAKFADTHGFSAVWTPERHFHAFGGPYPNPAVTGAAVAAVTKNIAVRGGSVVAPLHHPLRIAEDWAVIDNLTNGRAGLGMASGWHPVDFVLRPENCPPDNKKAMFDTIDKVRRLWRGETVAFDRGNGVMETVQSLPRPVSRELPLWLTIAGNPDTWREAGEIGANVLTHLLGQSIDEVADRIGIYHAALRKAGHDPANFTVTLMLHTYVARSRDQARETAREPMKRYLLAAAGLVKQYAWAFPAFKKPAGVSKPMDIDISTLSQDEVDGILDYAFARYFDESGLFGTVDDCLRRVEQLKAIGVSEIGCLIDYGIDPALVLEGLFPLAEVLRRANTPAGVAADDMSLAAQIRRHGVSHLQCTPSMARMLLADDGARAALGSVAHILLGGEAVPGPLAEQIATLRGGRAVQVMYGPTETTIWSTTGPAASGVAVADLGRPIANTTLHVLDADRRPVPLGMAGELWIGGAGVTRGYHNRPDLTADRFVTLDGARLYATGDRVRLTAGGVLEFLGRADTQVKIRGHRIEPGEIESALESLPGVRQAAVILREDVPGDQRLVAYVTGSADPGALRAALAARLPAAVVPSQVIALADMPLTPNRKIDRKALPAPAASVATAGMAAAGMAAAAVPQDPAASDTQAIIAAVWREALGVAAPRGGDNFFALGGHSLLAVQVHRTLRERLGLPGLSITDVFRFPVLSALAGHIDARLRPIRGAMDSELATPNAGTGAGMGTGIGAGTGTGQPAPDIARDRMDAMARRRQMRADRLSRPA